MRVNALASAVDDGFGMVQETNAAREELVKVVVSIQLYKFSLGFELVLPYLPYLQHPEVLNWGDKSTDPRYHHTKHLQSFAGRLLLLNAASQSPRNVPPKRQWSART